MKGYNVKRGVESTLERVYKNTGREFDQLTFSWSGTTAGVCKSGHGNFISANVIFPNIDESADVPNSLFHELIGYALHELGHVWFTDDEPWNIARDAHGTFVSNLINGLEDPRIERCVYTSGFAPNSNQLFQNLCNAVLLKDGYVQPDDLKNVPFLLAIEGRRLNGYHLAFDSIVDQSPWASDLHWALHEAHSASNTRQIVGIAVELYKRLQQQQDKQQDPQRRKGEQGKKGEQQQDQQDKQGEQQQDQQGKKKGKQSSQAGDQAGDQTNDQGEQGDKPGGSGKSSDLDGGREVEPRSFIEDRVAPHQAKCDRGDYARPNVGKPYIQEIQFH